MPRRSTHAHGAWMPFGAAALASRLARAAVAAGFFVVALLASRVPAGAQDAPVRVVCRVDGTLSPDERDVLVTTLRTALGERGVILLFVDGDAEDAAATATLLVTARRGALTIEVGLTEAPSRRVLERRILPRSRGTSVDVSAFELAVVVTQVIDELRTARNAPDAPQPEASSAATSQSQTPNTEPSPGATPEPDPAGASTSTSAPTSLDDERPPRSPPPAPPAARAPGPRLELAALFGASASLAAFELSPSARVHAGLMFGGASTRALVRLALSYASGLDVGNEHHRARLRSWSPRLELGLQLPEWNHVRVEAGAALGVDFVAGRVTSQPPPSGPGTDPPQVDAASRELTLGGFVTARLALGTHLSLLVHGAVDAPVTSRVLATFPRGPMRPDAFLDAAARLTLWLGIGLTL